MIKLAFLRSEDKPTVLTNMFGTPLVVKGWTGLPLVELVAWVILTLVARRKHPEWSQRKQMYAGALTAVFTLASEWFHDLAHAAGAWWINKPVNAIRIFWGTPLLIYYDINDQSVSPSQHLQRALAGPLFNVLLLPVLWFTSRIIRPGTFDRYAAEFALGANTFIPLASLLPIPFLDGGAILKWSLVKNGCSLSEADRAVKEINRYVGCGLAVTSGIAFKKRHFWLGAGLAVFAATSLAVGLGLLSEHK